MIPRDFLLAAHHRGLEAACADLLSGTFADDPIGLCACWRRFERSVEAHFAAEESLLLPGFAKIAPEQAQLVRDDHARIRRLLAEVGLEVDLHLVRARTVEALIDELHRHAEREDAFLYRWASEALDPRSLGELQSALAP
jgi:hypothetical protein